MPNLRVSLVPKDHPTKLDVSEHEHAMARNPKLQDITWRLVGNAAQGKFVSFAWITPPPPGIFDNPILGQQTLVVRDWNNGAASTGVWIYKLGVKVGNKTYETTSTIGSTTTASTSFAASGSGASPMMSNPTIRNN